METRLPWGWDRYGYDCWLMIWWHGENQKTKTIIGRKKNELLVQVESAFLKIKPKKTISGLVDLENDFPGISEKIHKGQECVLIWKYRYLPIDFEYIDPETRKTVFLYKNEFSGMGVIELKKWQ